MIVTGGTLGIGEAIVIRMVQAGATVIVTARSKESLDAVESKFVAMGGAVLCLQADVSIVGDNERVIGDMMSQFGRIDVLINNAAVFPARLSMQINETIWDEIVDTNLKGAFFLSKLLALKMMESGRGGRIINVLSTDCSSDWHTRCIWRCQSGLTCYYALHGYRVWSTRYPG